MKFKDYYATLGVARDADAAAVKKAYRQLARRYHPDVSKEPDTEERFKEVAEAYRTLKDPVARKAYDALGQRPAGQEFEPAPAWQHEFSMGGGAFDESDLADLFASLRAGGGTRRGRRPAGAMAGEDFELAVELSVEEAYAGRELVLSLSLPEFDAEGRMHRVPTQVRARVPAGASEGQRLRVPGKGGGGYDGGRRGDLYLTIQLAPHARYRVSGHDLYVDLRIAPWQAVLGTTVALVTPGGEVRLKVPPDTQNGAVLRLPGRGLPRRKHAPGDLHALVQLVLPHASSDAERALYRQLAELSNLDPSVAPAPA